MFFLVASNMNTEDKGSFFFSDEGQFGDLAPCPKGMTLLQTLKVAPIEFLAERKSYKKYKIFPLRFKINEM
ncbi:hypothetical protein HNY73_018777 [Argiope bruennichi]|uniref:Uncharacterized protein n=1 Tax=Argiope bruennichi TaxID=94029 RepID=A0A8T0EEM6_ARGBR|nr:hypothetical protein HNY73_018777 [Argiope bruennichi]